jgi:AraC-like DNA-binding protein
VNALNVISTSAAAPADRLALWGDVVWRHVGRLRSDAFGDRDFDGRLEFGDLADLKLCRIAASRHRVVRTPELIRRNEARGYLKLAIQLRGSACFEQGGRRVVLSPGEWSIYDTTRAYAVTNPESVEQLVVILPRERFDDLGVDMDELTVRRISGRAGVGRLAMEAIVGAFADLPRLGAGASLRAADRVTRLVREAMLSRAGFATDLSLRAAARERVVAYVEAQLRDPQLSLDRLSEAMGCSKRYLHKLFSDESETLSSYIWQERLARVRAELAAPAHGGRSITEIAFSWGFNSSPHFSRAFRGRYGVSPRAYRARATGGAPA